MCRKGKINSKSIEILGLEGLESFNVKADEDMLMQVIYNLIDNAIKFSDNGSSVDVSIHNDGENIYISITNYGKEISEEQKEKIFNKFYQADESHTGHGNGIGLAIVKAIVELHKGSVSVRSSNGISCFTVELPNLS